MAEPILVLDTGLRGARVNIAFDAALIEAHRAGAIGDTIRLLRFERSALVGRHQLLAREIDAEWCAANGVELARRLTGGGAIVFEPAQLGWELVVARTALPARLEEVARWICEAVAAGLARLGVSACFRPRNDIEVGGRKLCGTGGFFDGPTLFYQGTVLIDLDPGLLGGALRHPFGKLDRRGLASITERVVTLRELLGRVPAPEEVATTIVTALTEALGRSALAVPIPDPLERAAGLQLAEEIGTDGFVLGEERAAAGEGYGVGEHRVPGGTVRAHVRLRPGGERVIEDLWFEGDFFVAPARAMLDLEARLRGTRAALAESGIAAFFANGDEVAGIGVGPGDFAAALRNALEGVDR